MVKKNKKKKKNGFSQCAKNFFNTYAKKEGTESKEVVCKR